MMADKLTWTNDKRRLSELTPWEHNPRQIRKAEAERLRQSLEEFGQIHPIAIAPDGTILDGHQRQQVWSATKRFGPDYEVDVRVASRPLTEREHQKLVAMLHAGAVGGWDWDALASWSTGDLAEWGFDGDLLASWNDDAANLREMIEAAQEEPPADPGAQVDRAAELQEQWHTERGQLWEIPSKSVPGCCHRVLCGDSTEMDWAGATLVLTDPPYGINIVQGLRSTVGGSKPVTIGTVRPRRTDTVGGAKVRGTVGATNLVDATYYRPVEGDDKPFDPRWLLEIGNNQIIFGGNYFASKLPDSRCWIVWDKNNTGNFADAELAWTSFDRSVRLLKFTWNGLLREGSRQIEGIKRVHPTQKPAGLFANILSEFSEEGDVIADPYLGSGTSLVAGEIAGRAGIGGEIDPAYCAVTLERLAGLGLEPRLVE